MKLDNFYDVQAIQFEDSDVILLTYLIINSSICLFMYLFIRVSVYILIPLYLGTEERHNSMRAPGPFTIASG